jgi:RNA polymerase sigma-70 factor (ECF subfamily)
MTFAAAGTLRLPSNPSRQTRGTTAAQLAAIPVGSVHPDAGVAERTHLSDEHQQIAAARGGDATAFEALVRRHQTPLYNFCLRLLGNGDEAKDAVQETLVQLFGHLGSLAEHDRLSPWLFRVARNRCIDTIRRRRTVPLALVADDSEEAGALEPADEDPLPEVLAERADLQRLLADAIAALPPAYAEVVALRYAADQSFGEIAEILGESEGGVRVRFHRAKLLLRRRLQGMAQDV